MKRLITILITLILAVTLAGQSANTYKYPITIGSVGGTAGKLTLKGSTSGETVFQSSATGTTTVTGTVALPTTTSIGDVSATEIGYVNNVTSAIQTQIDEKETRIDSLVSVLSDTIDNATVFTKLAPDTVQHTANYTVAASDWGKDQHCLKATSILITIPANLTDWPVGGVMNFYGEGAGIMVFKKSSTVFISDKDSIATSRKGQAVTIKKIATNKYFLVGPLTD